MHNGRILILVEQYLCCSDAHRQKNTMDNIQSDAVAPRAPLNALTQLLLPEVALPILAAVRLPFAVKAAVSVVLLGSILHTFLTATSGVVVNDYAIGSAVLGNTFFNILLFVWIIDPMAEFRYLRDTDSSPLASRSFFSRLYNSLCIIRNYRLIGWNSQVRHQCAGPRLHLMLTVLDCPL